MTHGFIKGSIVGLSLLLLAGLLYVLYTARTDAQRAEQATLAALSQKNAALAEEAARLNAFLASPLCAGSRGIPEGLSTGSPAATPPAPVAP